MSTNVLGLLAVIIFIVLVAIFVAELAGPAAPISTVGGGNSAAAVATVATTVAPTIAPISQTNPATYTIQAGEWLSEIARRYNTTVPAILAANPQITDSDALQPGDTIVLPAPTE
ncbi:MAG: LysM peptidoglycan-binding domain-containing protein [Caldilineaceae bacterium]|nr:LysM peptidoglycan-binding domain-containing protein [Caldilineaceae bacterium]